MVAVHRERYDAVSSGSTAASELLDLIERGRPPWQADGLCQEHPEVDFFPGGKRHNREANAELAKAVCGRCLVREECFDYALADDDLVGVWGGTTETERRRLRVGKVA